MPPKRKAASGSQDGDRSDTEEPPQEGGSRQTKRVATNASKWEGMTKEAVLKSQMALWRSPAYNHFVMPPKIVDVKADGRTFISYEFLCKRNPSTSLTKRRDDTSTGNLTEHIRTCTPNTANDTSNIEGYAHGRSYSPEGFRLLLVKWVTTCSRPYAIVQDEPFVQMVHMLYNKATLVTPRTVSTDVKAVFRLAKGSLIKLLKGHKGQVHISCDGWTSPNVISFLGVIAHWNMDGKMVHAILDFIRLDRGHTGEYLAEQLLECLKGFGIESKILGIACDNASNNGTMIQALARKEPTFLGKQAQIRCLCHIINLIVKAVLSQFYSTTIEPATIITKQRLGPNGQNNVADAADYDSEGEEEATLAEIVKEMEEEKDEEDRFGDELERAEDLFDQGAVDDVNKEICDEIYSDGGEYDAVQFYLSQRDILHGRSSITKLVTLSKKIFNNPVLRDDLSTACRQSDKEEKVLIRPVVTRWNSLLPVISRSIELIEPLDTLCSLTRHNKRGSANLSRLYPSQREWDLLRQLVPLLAIFEEASLNLQQSDTPALYKTILLFDYLTGKLNSFMNNSELFAAVRAAAKRGLTMVNKYTTLCQDSTLPRLAIILHPRFKLQWFRDHGWTSATIEEASDALREIWIDRYKSKNPPAGDAIGVPAEIGADNVLGDRPPSFADYCMQNLQVVDDELTAYLSSTPDLTVKDPLHYWNQRSGDLARMAMDICGCPATSTDVERAFSGGRLTVSRMRHSLSSESTRASTVLGSWMKVPDLLPDQHLLKLFREKSHANPIIINID